MVIDPGLRHALWREIDSGLLAQRGRLGTFSTVAKMRKRYWITMGPVEKRVPGAVYDRIILVDHKICTYYDCVKTF